MSQPDTPAVADVREILYREALNEALRGQMRKDPTVFCIGFGIGERNLAYAANTGILHP